jgi:magnesium transporter
MIRSLVLPQAVLNGEEVALRRNLTRENLETVVKEDNFVWIDCVDVEEHEVVWLENTFHLHPAVVSDLRRDDRRPTLLVYPEYLFISLFQARLSKNAIASDEIHCLAGNTFFITVRHSTSTAIEIAYERAAQNGDYWKRGISYFLYLVFQFIIDSYYPVLDRVSNQLNKLEEQAMENGSKELQRSVYRVKQQLILLRQMVAPQREVISNVIGEERLSRTSEERELFRHLYERLLRIYDVIDSQRDLASNVLDLIESQESSKLATAVNRLTVLSMIFLPLTFLVGLFGLNFVTTKPEWEIPLPGDSVFILILLFTALSAAAMAYYFRKRGWL